MRAAIMNMSRMTLLCLWTTAMAIGCGGKRAGDGAAAPTDPRRGSAKSAFDTDREPPIAVETRYAAGQLAESQNNPLNAIRQYEEALKLKPDHVPSLYRLGVVHAQVKQYAGAIEAWKRYLKVTKESANGYANLGFCYELSGDSQAAEGAYQKGIARDPNHQSCRVNYGLMLARQDRTTDAITHLRAVLRPAEVAYNLGSVHEQRGRREQAKAEYRRALELDPTMSDAQQRLAALQ